MQHQIIRKNTKKPLKQIYTVEVLVQIQYRLPDISGVYG